MNKIRTNKYYTMGLAFVAGLLVAEAYKAGMLDGTLVLVAQSSDLPGDEDSDKPDPGPDPDGGEED